MRVYCQGKVIGDVFIDQAGIRIARGRSSLGYTQREAGRIGMVYTQAGDISSVQATNHSIVQFKQRSEWEVVFT
jgi:hypothetical protein